ncbi:MAG: threonine synthase [Thermodesulfobacteriota bacterium]
MSFVEQLSCKECGRSYPKKALHVCEDCFGPLEVKYDYAAIKKAVSREKIASRAPNIWRYSELLPVDEKPQAGLDVGFTPLLKAEKLGRALGHGNLYVKNDAVSFPTLSFKDRVVSVALSKALEFGYKTVSCASTGNLANAVASIAAERGLEAIIFIPHDLEKSKVINTVVYGAKLVGINGTYDDVNRLCSEIAGRRDWAFVNVNMRPYYSEGSKSLGFEIAEQMGWKVPRHIVVPMASGSLLTKIWKAFGELREVGLVDSSEQAPVMHGAQAAGCSPISSAVKDGRDFFKPVIPDTIAKSLSIGNPADGYYAIKVINESGGGSEDASDDEIREGIALLAETEGIYTETAGGVTVASAKKLIARGLIPDDGEPAVLCITGNGLKTQDAIENSVSTPYLIEPNIEDFEKMFAETNSK